MRRNEPIPDFLSAGHGSASFFVERSLDSQLEVLPDVLGLPLPDTVDGSVIASDVTLEDDRDCSGLSQVSQQSFDVPDRRLVESADRLCCLDADCFFAVVCSFGSIVMP